MVDGTQRRPDGVEAALARAAEGDLDGAIEIVERVVGADATDVVARRALVQLLRRRLRFTDALAAATAGPGAEDLHAEVAIVVAVLGDRDAGRDRSAIAETLAAHVRAGATPDLPAREWSEALAGVVRAERGPDVDARLARFLDVHPDDPIGLTLSAWRHVEELELASARAALGRLATTGRPWPKLADQVRDDLDVLERGLAAAGGSIEDPPEQVHDRLLTLFRADPEPSGPRPGADAPSILIVVRSIGPGGSEGQAVATAAALRGTGVDVAVLDADRDTADPAHVSTLAGAGVPHLRVSDFAPIGTRPTLAGEVVDAWNEREGAAGLEQAFEQLRPSVVHTMGKPGFVDFVALLARRAGIDRVVIQVPSMSPADRPDLLARRDYARRIRWAPARLQALLADDHVRFANKCEAGLASYRRWLGELPATATSVPNILDLPACRAGARPRPDTPWPDTAPVVGGVMTLSHEKRPLLWVEVVRRLLGASPDLHAVLLGDGPLEADVAAAADRVGPRLVVLGRRTPAVAWIATMDVLIITSRSEGLCGVALEAQALGTHVVAADVGGLPEAVVGPGTGTLVREHTDPDAYVTAVRDALRDGTRAARRAAAEPTLLARNSPQETGRALRRLYGIGPPTAGGPTAIAG